MGGLVQQGAEDLTGGAGQALAADHDFGVLDVGCVPAARSVVAPFGLPAVGPEAMMMTTGGTSGWLRRIAVQVPSKTASRRLAAGGLARGGDVRARCGRVAIAVVDLA